MQTGPLIIYTIGHSNRSFDEFLALLQEHGIERVLDVRTIPKSRHNPQFGQTELASALAQHHIAYTHIDKLGGLRKVQANSPNTAWRNKSFQGYADYMQTPEFEAGLEQAIDYGWKSRCVLMCAEAVPWRCHRSLVGDALLARHIRVEDIINHGKARVHQLTSFAQLKDQQLTYPDELA